MYLTVIEVYGPPPRPPPPTRTALTHPLHHPQAAAHGVPTVATCNGGPVDIMKTLHHGVVVDPTNPDAIAAELVRIVTTPDVWDGMSASGRTNIMAYSWPSHCVKYLETVEVEKRRVSLFRVWGCCGRCGWVWGVGRRCMCVVWAENTPNPPHNRVLPQSCTPTIVYSHNHLLPQPFSLPTTQRHQYSHSGSWDAESLGLHPSAGGPGGPRAGAPPGGGGGGAGEAVIPSRSSFDATGAVHLMDSKGPGNFDQSGVLL